MLQGAVNRPRKAFFFSVRRGGEKEAASMIDVVLLGVHNFFVLGCAHFVLSSCNFVLYLMNCDLINI